LRCCDLKENGGTAESNENLIPSRRDLQYAFMRFMIRCLAGDLDPKLPLSMYINGYKEDLWDEELLRDHQYKFDNLDVHMPANINMESIYCTYQVLSRLNSESNDKKDVAPVLQKRTHLPKRLPHHGALKKERAGVQ
jgi:hypothetical protein